VLNLFHFYIWEGYDRAKDRRGWWASKTDAPPAGERTHPHGPYIDADECKIAVAKKVRAKHPKAVVTYTYKCPEFRKDYAP